MDGNSKTQLPETCFYSSKPKLSRLSWWTSKTDQRRIRNSCSCHHRTVHIRRNAFTPEKKSINLAHLENGTYEQLVTHLERELELNGLEAPDELHVNTVSQQPTNTNADRPKPTCHHCKKPGHYRNQCRLLKKQRKQTENNQNNPRNKNSDTNNSNPNTNNNKNSNWAERMPKTVYPPCETCGKTNHSTEKCYFGANAAKRPPPRHRRAERQNYVQERAIQSDSNETPQAAAQKLN